MEKLLKKGSNGLIFKLDSMEVKQKDENIPEEFKKVPWKSIIESSKKFLKGYLHLEIMNTKMNSYLEVLLLIKGIIDIHINKKRD
jgi:hypothetical protein